MPTLHRLSLLTVVVLCAGQAGCAWFSGSRAGSGGTPIVSQTSMRSPAMYQGPAMSQGDALVWREGMEVQWSVQSASAPANRSMAGKGVVGPDGTIELGPYGAVRVAGLTDRQAQTAVVNHVSTYLSDPQVTLIPVFATTPSVRVQAAASSLPPSRYPVNQTAWQPYQPAAETSNVVVTEPQPAASAPSPTLGQRIVSFVKGP